MNMSEIVAKIIVIAFLAFTLGIPIMIIVILLREGLDPVIEYEKSNFYEVEAKVISEEKISHDFLHEYNYKCEYVVNNNEYATYVKSFFKEKDDVIEVKYNPNSPKETISGKVDFDHMMFFIIILVVIIYYLIVFRSMFPHKNYRKGKD